MSHCTQELKGFVDSVYKATGLASIFLLLLEFMNTYKKVWSECNSNVSAPNCETEPF